MLSLRIKLTLYYLAILSAILFFFGIAIYTYVYRSLTITIDESLTYQVKKIERIIKQSSGGGEPGVGEENTERPLTRSTRRRTTVWRSTGMSCRGCRWACRNTRQ